MAQQMHDLRLQGLKHEVARAALAGVAREEIDEVIDTSLASDDEKSALRLYSWSFVSRVELRRLALGQLRGLSLDDQNATHQAGQVGGEQLTE